jgi:hypothetical protein
MPAGHALRLIASAALLATPAVASAATPVSLAAGSTVPPEVTVSDQRGAPVRLRALLGAQPGRINVVFIFGGGDLGTGQPGHLWCQDSFEDTHILRTLAEKYRGKLGFVAIASAPVYHSGALGAPNRVFLDAADDSAEFRKARDSFVASTQASLDAGILPFQPHYDFRLRLMLNPNGRTQPGAGYGEREPWVGAFRAEGETQFYGVPSYWLIDDDGTVLAEPFRGNVYHPHGGEMRIAYTLADVDAAVARLLAGSPASAMPAAPAPARPD